MNPNALPITEYVFNINRVGCERCKQVVDMKKGVVYNYCELLANFNCKTTTCYLQNCPIVNEKIDPNKIGYDPQKV